MHLPANASWFTFEIEGGESLSVYGFKGAEKISEPYEFEVELVSRRPVADPAGFIGLPALLRISDKNALSGSAPDRLVHGYVRRMDELHSAGGFTHYRAVLVPRLWFLGRTANFMIFQEDTVLRIIDSLLRAQGFTSEMYDFKCFKPEERYKPRDYCVQYGESDLHFISRLCEEEGIYYYFEHSAKGHKLIFSDMPGGEGIPGESSLRYLPATGMPGESAVVQSFSIRHSVDAGEVSLREWNFEKPGLNLLLGASAPQGRGEGLQEALHPEALTLEEYAYPNLYALQAEGSRYAGLALLRRLSLERVARGRTSASRFTPGYTFELSEHQGAAQAHDGAWWLLSVRHLGEQPQVLQEAAPERGMSYQAEFEAIPDSVRYLPPLAHPKRLADGGDSAIVNGPEDQEIHTDKYGRVKLRFHWDRRPAGNGNSSCWARVSQAWAGAGFGGMSVPRVGEEVIVEYLNGDPDRPVVTGRVYNAGQMPPYELDAHKTRTVLKSMSTPGEAGAERGFNELRVEDLSGEEEIYAHAQRDLNLHVENSFKDHVLSDRHASTDASAYSQVGGEAGIIVGGPRKAEARADMHLTVSGDSHAKAADAWLLEAGEEIHIKAGMKAVIEAGATLSVSVGGSFLTLSAAGVMAGGAAVNLGGGGAPGSGSGASPLLPGEARVPEKALPPAGVEEGAEEEAVPEEECIRHASATRSAVVTA